MIQCLKPKVNVFSIMKAIKITLREGPSPETAWTQAGGRAVHQGQGSDPSPWSFQANENSDKNRLLQAVELEHWDLAAELIDKIRTLPRPEDG